MESDVTVGDIKDSFPDNKPDALWTRFVLRPLSFPIAWLFIKLGFSANQVTYLSIISVFAGAGLFLLESYTLGIVSAVIFNLFALLDCVDGNIARVTEGGNPYGEWVDAVGGYISYTLLFISAGMFVEMTYQNLGALDGVDFLLIGTVAAVTNLLMRVQHQKYENLNEPSHSTGGGDSLQKKISRNVGITGFLMPAVFVGAVFGLLHWILVFYVVFYSIAWVFVTLRRIAHVESA